MAHMMELSAGGVFSRLQTDKQTCASHCLTMTVPRLGHGPPPCVFTLPACPTNRFHHQNCIGECLSIDSDM
eukprot:994585-Amphidinium_carterae.1